MANSYWITMKKQEAYKKSWLRLNANLTEESGIYILTRVDDNGILYAYVGQAKKILTRLAQHSLGYQHIDLSLKKHKLYKEDNPYGWKVDFVSAPIEQLNELERKYIVEYASKGYQLRNKTAGGQDKGKVGIDDNKASKGYHDGLKQGKLNAYKEIKVFFDKYLVVLPKTTDKKKNGDVKEIYIRKWKEFKELLNGKSDIGSDTNDRE